MALSKHEKGFTLVELLIVIAIIAVLTLLGATNWITQQKKARDARRKADLEQLRSALEMYRTDTTTNVYPYKLSDVTAIDKNLTMDNALAGYISPIPCDPIGKPNCAPDSAYHYMYTPGGTPGGTTYTLSATLEFPVGTYTVSNP
jgi:prepilin-type N-terminal cleavage/methylation domain-containing protein